MHHPKICLDTLKIIMKTLSQGGWRIGQNLYRVVPEYNLIGQDGYSIPAPYINTF
jgi:hypothetical protein